MIETFFSPSQPTALKCSQTTSIKFSDSDARDFGQSVTYFWLVQSVPITVENKALIHSPVQGSSVWHAAFSKDDVIMFHSNIELHRIALVDPRADGVGGEMFKAEPHSSRLWR